MTHEQVITTINTYANHYNRDIAMYQDRLVALMNHGGSQNEIAWAKEDLARAYGAHMALETLKRDLETDKRFNEELEEFRAHLGRY